MENCFKTLEIFIGVSHCFQCFLNLFYWNYANAGFFFEKKADILFDLLVSIRKTLIWNERKENCSVFLWKFWEMIEIYKIKLVGIKKAFCMQITHRRRSLYELCCTFFYTNHVGCCRALPAKKYHFCMHGLIQNEFAFDSA